jgi:hypothetical protein
MSMPKTSFSYVVLRYMHDVLTREFVNVAVLLYAPEEGFLGFEKLSSLDRVRGMFPGLQSDSLRDLLVFLASRANEVGLTAAEMLSRDLLSASDVAKSLLPIDDSALQWSQPGGGITSDPQGTLKELFERLVARHLKAHPPTRRRDSDVWKPFEQELRKREVSHYLHDKVLTAGELRHHFENAWEPAGGYLRVFQPLSFDLLEASDIVEKAITCNGVLRQLRKGHPDFYIYLLLGRPAGSSRNRAFAQAYETLAEDGGRKEIFPEEQAAQFAEAVEKEIKGAGQN